MKYFSSYTPLALAYYTFKYALDNVADRLKLFLNAKSYKSEVQYIYIYILQRKINTCTCDTEVQVPT